MRWRSRSRPSERSVASDEVRAVLDVNVIVSATLTPDGVSARVVEAWLRGGFELIVSPRLLEELQRVLAYPKIRRKLDTDDARASFEVVILWATVRDDPPPVTGSAPDPADDYLVELARVEGAALVTGDKQLLALTGDLPVYPPADFLSLLEA